MTELRKSLPPLPSYMQDLPVADNGYPVPFFVSWFNGKPDFRVINRQKIFDCINQRLCWCCGKPIQGRAAFVGGPLMVFNNMSAEPPNHPECAEWAVKACPFMLFPNATRRTANLPSATTPYAPGKLLDDNPGVSVVLHCSGFVIEEASEDCVAFRALGVTSVDWYSEGQSTPRERALRAYVDRVGGVVKSLGPKPSTPDLDAIEHMANIGAQFLPKE